MVAKDVIFKDDFALVKGKTLNYVCFCDMTWPLPTGAEGDSLSWKLRYGEPTKHELLLASSVVSAYNALVYKTQKQRNFICKRIQEANEMQELRDDDSQHTD